MGKPSDRHRDRDSDDAEEGELVDAADDKQENNRSSQRYKDRSSHRSPKRRRSRSRSRSRSRDRHHRRRREDKDKRDTPVAKPESSEEDDEEFQKRVEAALEPDEEEEERLIEERRRRRQEILAKHGQQHPIQQQQPKNITRDPSAASLGKEDPALSDNEDAAVAELGVEEGGALNIWGEQQGKPPAGGAEGDNTNAAMNVESGIGEAAAGAELEQRLQAHLATKPAQPAAADGIDDMFADTPEDVKASNKQLAAQAPAAAAAPTAVARPGLQDNYDDADGYYNFQVGELLADRYEVYATHGRGVFSSVLRARDLQSQTPSGPMAVAIKVIRSNDTMYKAGQMEKVILRKLGGADPEGKRHCIKLLGSFEYRNHLCLVFEPLDMNLRELTKRYGRGIGLSISAVRIYTQQMLVALYHLKNCGVLHADIKPDNILVNDRRTVVKICDFGSAMFSGDNEITPYLCSRFYRPPEVMLGLPYDHPMDMWSVGCVVYELFTGRILFPGKTNNEMLKLIMNVKGPFPKKMLKKAEFAFKHFEGDANISFALLEEDPVTKRPVRRLIANPSVKHDFAALLAGQSPDKTKLMQLADLLERMMALDPDKRITPKEALRHPFIKEVAAPQVAPAMRPSVLNQAR